MTVRDVAIAMGFQVDESSVKEVESKINDVKSFAMDGSFFNPRVSKYRFAA